MPLPAPVVYSLLDLAPIIAGSTPAQSYKQMLELAQHAERWGYHRFWLAEHHNIPGVASAATSVLIGHVAQGTKTIRVGSGGIMLPNHAPLVIAEQFGTLESLFPGRIDLGIGRAPGGDQMTARALRRGLGSDGDTFPNDLLELMGFFKEESAETGSAKKVRAIPGQGLQVPVYLLGSSDFSARLAARLGLPFAFASHFAPDYLHAALALYRERFEPSAAHPKPYAMVGLNIVAADTDDQAVHLFTSIQQQFLNLIRGQPGMIPPPVDSMEDKWSYPEEIRVEQMTRFAAVGSPPTIRRKIHDILEVTHADELIVTASIHDPLARLHSFELAAEVLKSFTAASR